MAEVTKLLYVVVVDSEEKKGGKESFRYTRSVLQNVLHLIGCKPRHAFKISQRVFELLRTECSGNSSISAGISSRSDLNVYALKESIYGNNACLGKPDESKNSNLCSTDREKSKPFELYKRRTTIFVRRKTFFDIVCDTLAEYKYVGTNQRADLILACRIRERKESVTVLLCGTSGCGKSTLSALLGSRLGITTVVSTDSIRHMMRSFVDEKENPLLWASTYHAGEYLDPSAVAEAKARRKAKKLAGVSHTSAAKDDYSSTVGRYQPEGDTIDFISAKQMAVEGFKAQSEMVIDSLDRLITAWEERRESVVVEGVHLSLNFVMGLMKKHPSIIPFMVHITNEEKHLERFAVRAKYMTLDPAKNKYVKYIRNIRTIQEFLCKRADKHLVPKINNTNVDRSVAAIHATVFSCLRRRDAGDKLYDPLTNTVAVVGEEYRNQCAANSLSSKGMFQLIQRKGSSRHLMALVNTDGSVAKAWPVNSVYGGIGDVLGHTIDNWIGSPMYGPLQIGKAEPVNLHFGHFGISAWPSDTGGTSRASSIDESREYLTDNGSRYHSYQSSYHSSCCSSPRASEYASKELKEEHSVHGSDEEADDPPELDTDEDFSDDGQKQIQEEMEGSVDEESTKSDEDYDDLAMLDILDNGYLTDYYQDEFKDTVLVPTDQTTNRLDIICGQKYHQDLNVVLKTKIEHPSELPRYFQPSNPGEKNERRVSSPAYAKMRKRSLSIPAFQKRGTYINGPTASGPPPR